jgi:hypothetical protein
MKLSFHALGKVPFINIKLKSLVKGSSNNGIPYLIISFETPTEKLFIRFVLNLEVNVNMMKKIYKNQICNKIFQNMKSDPKTFWYASCIFVLKTNDKI